MDSLSVDLVKDSKFFFSGEKIEGHVTIFCSNSRKIKKIALKIFGETKTGFFDSKRKKKFKSHEIHLNVEKNLTEELKLLCNKNGETPAGIHKIPFTFFLPQNLPSSIKCDFGWTRYFFSLCAEDLKAEAEAEKEAEVGAKKETEVEAKKEAETEVEFEFDVVAFIPLEYHKNLEKEIRKTEEWKEKGFFSRNGSISVELRLPKEEFLVGEVIRTTIFVQNSTSAHTVHNVGVGLLQILSIKFEDEKSSKIETATVSRTLVETSIGPIEHPGIGKFEGSLTVPISAPPTQIGGLISIRYRVAVIGDKHIPPDISVPILIGHRN